MTTISLPSISMPSEVVATSEEKQEEAERIASENEQEKARALAENKAKEQALAAVSGNPPVKLGQKLFTLLEKTATGARDSRGIVHELWSHLRPIQHWFPSAVFAPGLVFTGDFVRLEGIELAGGTPIPADVIKVLIRNGAAANLEQIAVILLAQADAYSAIRHGCCFAGLVGMAISYGRMLASVPNVPFHYRQMWDIWILGIPYDRVAANRAIWRSWVGVTARNFWQKSAPPFTILGRVGYVLPKPGPNSSGLPDASITWPRIVAWMMVLSYNGQIPAVFCGEIDSPFRTHAINQNGGVTRIRLPPLVTPSPDDFAWVATRLSTFAAQQGTVPAAHYASVENLATQHFDAPQTPLRRYTLVSPEHFAELALPVEQLHMIEDELQTAFLRWLRGLIARVKLLRQ